MPRNEKLKRAIEEVKSVYKLRQSEIAERLEVTGSYLSDMINGRVPLTDKIVSKLSEFFHINPLFLKIGKGEVMLTSTVAMESIPTYSNTGKGKKEVRIETEGYERIISALEDTISAKDETIASQRYTIEALKRQIEELRRSANFFSKEK